MALKTQIMPYLPLFTYSPFMYIRIFRIYEFYYHTAIFNIKCFSKFGTHLLASPASLIFKISECLKVHSILQYFTVVYCL